MTCPDCYGTGAGNGRDLVVACETCDGEGVLYGDVEIEERDRIFEENLYLYGGAASVGEGEQETR